MGLYWTSWRLNVVHVSMADTAGVTSCVGIMKPINIMSCLATATFQVWRADDVRAIGAFTGEAHYGGQAGIWVYFGIPLQIPQLKGQQTIDLDSEAVTWWL